MRSLTLTALMLLTACGGESEAPSFEPEPPHEAAPQRSLFPEFCAHEFKWYCRTVIRANDWFGPVVACVVTPNWERSPDVGDSEPRDCTE